MSNSLRIIFAGTPTFAAHHLKVLISSSHNVIGVFTQPDRPAGRKNQIKSSPVKQLAKLHNLPIFQPYSLCRAEDQQCIADLGADIIVVVAYSIILPQVVLNLPRFGCINVHGSLLPYWRGAAPIQRALWACNDQTGITIIQMDNGLDTGDMLYKAICDIHPNDTSVSLHNKLAQIGSNALLITLERIATGNITAEPQNNALATYAKKLNKEEARLNWYLPAIQLEHCIRAFNPWPVSYFSLTGQLIKVWSASVQKQKQSLCAPGTILAADKSGIHVATGKDILILKLLQPAGKKIMTVQDLLNSRRELFIPGTVLS